MASLIKQAIPIESCSVIPIGIANKASNTNWNNTATFFAPGSTLFIGFETLPTQFTSLNQKIADLLRYLPPLTVAGTI